MLMNLNGYHSQTPVGPQSVYYFDTSNNKQGSVFFMSSDATPNVYHVMFSIDDEVSITGGGDSYRIFATIVKILRDFIKERKGLVNVLVFDALRKSRIDLYRAMLKKFSKSDNFNFKEEQSKSLSGNPKSTFFLTAI